MYTIKKIKPVCLRWYGRTSKQNASRNGNLEVYFTGSQLDFTSKTEIDKLMTLIVKGATSKASSKKRQKFWYAKCELSTFKVPKSFPDLCSCTQWPQKCWYYLDFTGWVLSGPYWRLEFPQKKLFDEKALNIRYKTLKYVTSKLQKPISSNLVNFCWFFFTGSAIEPKLRLRYRELANKFR